MYNILNFGYCIVATVKELEPEPAPGPKPQHDAASQQWWQKVHCFGFVLNTRGEKVNVKRLETTKLFV
jgi:hypothetical protein